MKCITLLTLILFLCGCGRCPECTMREERRVNHEEAMKRLDDMMYRLELKKELRGE
jgi:hypothetical protein